jgi:hypothetical protein
MGQVYHGVAWRLPCPPCSRLEGKAFRIIGPLSEPGDSARKPVDLPEWTSSNLRIESQLAVSMMPC